jgi:hypothetical protein
MVMGPDGPRYQELLCHRGQLNFNRPSDRVSRESEAVYRRLDSALSCLVSSCIVRCRYKSTTSEEDLCYVAAIATLL